MEREIKTQIEQSEIEEEGNPSYSLEMIDTMFADSLSRGMQNAITSQQNAQMASSASITSACARILQAATEQAIPEKPTESSRVESVKKTVEVQELGGTEEVEISSEQRTETESEPVKPESYWHWLVWPTVAAVFIAVVAYFYWQLHSLGLAVEQSDSHRTVPAAVHQDSSTPTESSKIKKETP